MKDRQKPRKKGACVATHSCCTRFVPHENIANLSEASKFADKNLLAFLCFDNVRTMLSNVIVVVYFHVTIRSRLLSAQSVRYMFISVW